MQPLYIFDLDGTLADATHRLHFIDRKDSLTGEACKPDWPAFFAACPKDAPIPAVIGVLRALRDAGADIWVWTGRSATVMQETVLWLQTHCGYRETEMLRMRHEWDRRPDHEVKAGWLQEMWASDRERLVAIFEDRSRVVQMWRENGIPCFQVAPGDF